MEFADLFFCDEIEGDFLTLNFEVGKKAQDKSPCGTLAYFQIFLLIINLNDHLCRWGFWEAGHFRVLAIDPSTQFAKHVDSFKSL